MKAVVDRIEEGIAVLILSGNNEASIRLPFFLLPDSREGDIVDILVIKNEAETTDARERSRKMIEKLK
ncbi:MAG: DUF3006 domain-containing protein [Methanomicrobiales archaeon]